MTWSDQFDRVEAVATRAEAALVAGDPMAAAAAIAELGMDHPVLPRPSAAEAERARQVIDRLDALEGRCRAHLRRVADEVAAVGRRRPGDGAAQYVDTTA